MRIGEIARRTGTSERLLRYYEEQGLLHPTRLPNGYRTYTEADLTAVARIRILLAAGLPTSVIAHILDCFRSEGARLVPDPCPELVVHLRRERARIAEAITRLRTSQDALDTLLATALGAADPLPVHATGTPDSAGRPAV